MFKGFLGYEPQCELLVRNNLYFQMGERTGESVQVMNMVLITWVQARLPRLDFEKNFWVAGPGAEKQLVNHRRRPAEAWQSALILRVIRT